MDSRDQAGPLPGEPPATHSAGDATATVPAIVLGSGFTALGVVRNLAGAGIPTYTAGDVTRLVSWSRWHRPVPRRTAERATPATLASFLMGLRIDRAVLVPCSDHWALAVAHLPALLAERFSSSLPPLAVLQTLTDKAAFARYCEAEGIPCPRTWVVDEPKTLLDLPAEAFTDAFLKPCDSQRFQARYGLKAVRVTDREHAHQLACRYAADGFRVLLQRYVPGPASNHYFVDGFVDRRADLRALFVRQRLRMAPPDFGNSSYMVSVPPSDAAPAVEAIRRVTRGLRYRGVFSAEFKRDAADGVFRILEINARPWWYVRFAAQCGVNVCRMAWADAVGAPVPTQSTYRTGQHCMNAYYDYFACRAMWWAGELSLRSWAGSWLRSRKCTFEWADPLPAFVGAARTLRGALGRRVAGAYRALSSWPHDPGQESP